MNPPEANTYSSAPGYPHGQYGYPEPTAYRAPGYTIFLAGIYKIFGFKEHLVNTARHNVK